LQNDVNILKVGDKVGASDATLLNMLKISPFTYGLELEQGEEGRACVRKARSVVGGTDAYASKR